MAKITTKTANIETSATRSDRRSANYITVMSDIRPNLSEEIASCLRTSSKAMTTVLGI